MEPMVICQKMEPELIAQEGTPEEIFNSENPRVQKFVGSVSK